MTKRALLVLIGGRQVPNVLTAQALKPDLIVPIASHEAVRPEGAWETVAPALRRLCPHGLQAPVVVDGFERRETYQACRQALFDTQDAEWVVNVSCGSKVMGFGVYDAAMPDDLPMPVSIWYLDTASRRSVVLKGREPKVDLYRLTVAEYFEAYGRKAYGSNPRPGEGDFAKLMASDLRSDDVRCGSSRDWRPAQGAAGYFEARIRWSSNLSSQLNL